MYKDAEEIQPQMFKVEWQLPVSLEFDPDLNDDDAEDEGEIYYGDNLVVKVSVLNYIFEVARRFIICNTQYSLKIQPEENWSWNEHGDLSTQEQDLFEFIINKCPEYFTPPDAFIEKLKSIL